MKIGLFCGSFDPFHYGHLKVVKQALKEVDHLIVAACGNPSKQGSYLFSLEEAGALVHATLKHADLMSQNNITLMTSKHSLVNIVLDFGVDVIFRGVRDEEDTKQEQIYYEHIQSLLPGWATWKTVPVPTVGYRKLSSSMIKGLVSEGMDTHVYLNGTAKAATEKKILKHHRFAVVGPAGSGKTTLCKELMFAYESFAHYEVNKEPYKVLTDNYFGARKLARETESISKNVLRWSDVPSIKLKKYLNPRHNLSVYAKRERRQFLKKTNREIVLLEDDDLLRIGTEVNGNVIVVMEPDAESASAALIEKAEALRKLIGHGRVFKATKPFNIPILLGQLQVGCKIEDSYARNRAVPDHKEARRGFFRDDVPS